MTCNMGKIDRIIRGVLGAIALAIAIINGSIITGVIGVLLLDINTCCDAKKD